MTAHTRRNKRNRTEIDIATQYFEEEKERTKQILKKKQQKNDTKIKGKKSLPNPSSKSIRSEKKKIPRKRIERKTSKHYNRNKKESNSYSKQKKLRKRSVFKKGRNIKKKVIKRAKTQYFQRFKV